MVNINKVKPADLWYVIGFITSDGYLSSDKRHINITSKDRDHLYEIRTALCLENAIGKKSRGGTSEKNFSQLQVGDVNFYGYLQKLGLTSRKSLTIGPLNIDDNFFIDFLRGVIDGDGNISTWVHKSNYNHQWCLRVYSASRIFIEWLNTRIKQEFNLEGRLYSRKAKNRVNFIYTLKFGKLSALIILKKVYYKGSLSLERKYLQAKLCLQKDCKNGKLYT